MNNRDLVSNWKAEIRLDCEKRLGRRLKHQEEKFINSRNGFIALEIIEDTIRSKIDNELEEYLNSEHEN
jgi:hypothetical protein